MVQIGDDYDGMRLTLQFVSDNESEDELIAKALEMIRRNAAITVNVFRGDNGFELRVLFDNKNLGETDAEPEKE